MMSIGFDNDRLLLLLLRHPVLARIFRGLGSRGRDGWFHRGDVEDDDDKMAMKMTMTMTGMGMGSGGCMEFL